jgi:hypothetical protein
MPALLPWTKSRKKAQSLVLLLHHCQPTQKQWLPAFPPLSLYLSPFIVTGRVLYLLAGRDGGDGANFNDSRRKVGLLHLLKFYDCCSLERWVVVGGWGLTYDFQITLLSSTL